MQLSNPKIKMLRDELARAMTDVKKRDPVIEELVRALEDARHHNDIPARVGQAGAELV